MVKLESLLRIVEFLAGVWFGLMSVYAYIYLRRYDPTIAVVVALTILYIGAILTAREKQETNLAVEK